MVQDSKQLLLAQPCASLGCPRGERRCQNPQGDRGCRRPAPRGDTAGAGAVPGSWCEGDNPLLAAGSRPQGAQHPSCPPSTAAFPSAGAWCAGKQMKRLSFPKAKHGGRLSCSRAAQQLLRARPGEGAGSWSPPTGGVRAGLCRSHGSEGAHSCGQRPDPASQHPPVTAGLNKHPNKHGLMQLAHGGDTGPSPSHLMRCHGGGDGTVGTSPAPSPPAP